MSEMSTGSSNKELKEIVSLLNAENKPLQSDEIADKLNKDTKQVLRILWNRSCRKTIKIVINKNQKACICQPSYKLEQTIGTAAKN